VVRKIALGSIAALLLAVVAPARVDAQNAVPACIKVATASRYVPYGYNHIVVLTSSCTKKVTCTVSTDVNPDKQTVEVAPSASVEVTTFMGSPSQTFTARVSCTKP
jgi:hypothetical protein